MTRKPPAPSLRTQEGIWQGSDEPRDTIGVDSFIDRSFNQSPCNRGMHHFGQGERFPALALWVGSHQRYANLALVPKVIEQFSKTWSLQVPLYLLPIPRSISQKSNTN